MAKQSFIDLYRNELAVVSYFPALELKGKPKAERIETVLIPLLLPIARRRNKKISEIPITFWPATRQSARQFREELFLFMTPPNLGAVAKQVIEETLQNMQYA